MAKGLPYFKFTPSEWLTGDICFEDLESQGLFINICAWYWQRDGVLSVDDINKRYNKPTALVSLSNRFFNVENNQISIAFLDEQLIERKHQSKENSKNGKLGGRPKRPKTLEEKPTAFISLSEIEANEKAIRIRKEEEKKRIRTKTRKISFEDSELFDKDNFVKHFPTWHREKLRHYYDAALRYSIEGNKYVSWELAIQNWERRDAAKGMTYAPIVEEMTQAEINKQKEREFYARL